MSEQDRQRWDRKHGTTSAETPRPLASLGWIPRSRGPDRWALDLACGSGRHVRPLLERGYRVVAADGSIEGLRRIRVEQDRRIAGVRRVQFDADAWPFAPNKFDVIVQTDFLDRAVLQDVLCSVRPGGLILIDTFAGPGGPGTAGPSNSDYRLRSGELAVRFARWTILRHEHGDGREALLARAPQNAL